jgi:hypothetical protein
MEICIRRYICANKECQATWRILPAFLARHLWRVWPTVERVALPATPPAVVPAMPLAVPVATSATPLAVATSATPSAAVPATPLAVATCATPLAVATSATPLAVLATPPAPIPKRTAQRWRARLASQAKQLVVLLAVSGGALLEAIAKKAGHWATRAELVDVHARMTKTLLAPGRRLADLAALVHRLERGLRLM